jgi:hypothetical protein
MFRSLVWFIRLPYKKYNIMSWKKKEFEDIEYLPVSFRQHFVLVGDNFFNLYHVLFTLINICGIDCQKSYNIKRIQIIYNNI